MDKQQWLEWEFPCKTLPLVMERGRAGLCWDLGKVRGIQNCRQSKPPKERENWKTEN